MEPFADIGDVVDVMGSLDAAQTAAAPGNLAQASMLMRGWGIERGLNIDELIEDDEVRTAIVKGAIVQAVKRALGNLNGVLETTVALDDYRRTERRDQSTSTGQLYIDDNDLTGLIPAKQRSRFGTLRMGTAL